MAWPVAYRGGIKPAAAAAAVPWPGFQWPSGGAEQPWFKGGRGGLRFAGRLLGAAGLAVGIVELFRYYQGGPVVGAGWTVVASCGAPAIGPFSGDHAPFASCGDLLYKGDWTGPGMIYTGPTYKAAFYFRSAYKDGSIFVGLPGQQLRAGLAVQTQPYENRLPIWLPRVAVGQPAVPQSRPLPGTVPWYGNPPAVPTLPESSVGAQPVWAAPGVRPGTSAHVFTGAGYKPTTLPDVRTHPGPATREQKMRMSPGLAAVVTGFNAATELLDLVNALYGALDKNSECLKGVKGPVNQVFKANAVNHCFADINWSQAMFNIAWNNLEDEIWAKLGLPTKEAGMSYGANAPANIALSKALGKPVTDATKYVEAYMQTAFQKLTGWNDAKLQQAVDTARKSQSG